MHWQARRDLNPQPSDLESAALPIRATGLKISNLLTFLMLDMFSASGTVLIQL